MEKSKNYFEELKQSVLKLFDCFKEGERIDVEILVIYIGNLCVCFNNFCLTYTITNVNEFNKFKQSIIDLCDYFKEGRRLFNDEMVYYTTNVGDKFHDYFSTIHKLERINS
jgi:hypothetical protein